MLLLKSARCSMFSRGVGTRDTQYKLIQSFGDFFFFFKNVAGVLVSVMSRFWKESLINMLYIIIYYFTLVLSTFL